MQNQRAKMATRVPKGMAAEEPSPQRIRFMIKKSANTILKDSQKQNEGTVTCDLSYNIRDLGD